MLRRIGWVADENIQLTGLPPSQGGLTDGEVQGLVDAGWELDTQGISHADLITLDAAQLKDQIVSARQILRRRYHVPVDWFCYPSGHYNATVIAAVRAGGLRRIDDRRPRRASPAVGSLSACPACGCWAAPARRRCCRRSAAAASSRRRQLAQR